MGFFRRFQRTPEVEASENERLSRLTLMKQKASGKILDLGLAQAVNDISRSGTNTGTMGVKWYSTEVDGLTFGSSFFDGYGSLCVKDGDALLFELHSWDKYVNPAGEVGAFLQGKWVDRALAYAAKMRFDKAERERALAAKREEQQLKDFEPYDD